MSHGDQLDAVRDLVSRTALLSEKNIYCASQVYPQFDEGVQVLEFERATRALGLRLVETSDEIVGTLSSVRDPQRYVFLSSRWPHAVRRSYPLGHEGCRHVDDCTIFLVTGSVALLGAGAMEATEGALANWFLDSPRTPEDPQSLPDDATSAAGHVFRPTEQLARQVLMDAGFKDVVGDVAEVRAQLGDLVDDYLGTLAGRAASHDQSIQLTTEDGSFSRSVARGLSRWLGLSSPEDSSLGLLAAEFDAALQHGAYRRPWGEIRHGQAGLQLLAAQGGTATEPSSWSRADVVERGTETPADRLEIMRRHVEQLFEWADEDPSDAVELRQLLLQKLDRGTERRTVRRMLADVRHRLLKALDKSEER